MRIAVDFPAEILNRVLALICTTYGHAVCEAEQSELVIVMTAAQATHHLSAGRKVIQFDTRTAGSQLLDVGPLPEETAARFRGFQLVGDAGNDDAAMLQYLATLGQTAT